MKTLPISIPLFHKEDIKLFTNIINQGIDSRLDGFTKSKFWTENNRLEMDIHPDEVPLLLRRLSEDETVSIDFSEQWVDDILYAWYEIGPACF